MKACSRLFAVAAVIAGMATGAFAQTPGKAVQHVQQGGTAIEISTVSARNDMVTGGDVLVRIAANEATGLQDLRINVNGSEVTQSFRPANDGALTGLVSGLRNGDNLIEVTGPSGL